MIGSGYRNYLSLNITDYDIIMLNNTVHKAYYKKDGTLSHYALHSDSTSTSTSKTITSQEYSEQINNLYNNKLPTPENDDWKRKTRVGTTKFNTHCTAQISTYDNNVPGFLFGNDLHVISTIAKTIPENGIIVEIGSFMGKSSVAWADNCHTTVQVYCIDPLPEFTYNGKWAILERGKTYNMKEEFLLNTKRFLNIKMITGISPNNIDSQYINIISNLRNIDCVFLDSAHVNPTDWQNIQYYVPKMRVGAILCGHDYSESWPDVITNVRRLESIFEQKVTVYYNSSIWSFRIPNNFDYNLLKNY